MLHEYQNTAVFPYQELVKGDENTFVNNLHYKAQYQNMDKQFIKY